MIIQPCRSCGQRVSIEALTCPHCGAPKPTAAAQEKERAGKKIVGIGCLVLLGLAATCFILTPSSTDSSAKGWGDPGTAAIMCQEFVKRRLIAPSTADFPNAYGSETRTTTLGQGRYRVLSYVDAQNGFGAQIRTQFECTIHKIHGVDRWELDALTM